MARIVRIAPSRMVFRGFEDDVVSATTFPPGKHTDSPIVNEMSAVRFQNAAGDSRWYGFADAFIGLDLRMHVILAPGQERNAYFMAWEIPDRS